MTYYGSDFVHVDFEDYVVIQLPTDSETQSLLNPTISTTRLDFNNWRLMIFLLLLAGLIFLVVVAHMCDNW